ncbi:type 1 glutamine amidotransferase domain-containing protein [Leifsonia sp. TF02-11]|uniref:type 1 glutamine amidotransferase domain-containing protein n=1 Tax=Leifsonia sp. TF02-11 TaxID=2815212 RepID=UPI001AA1B652|nr:type 1 glutamine amidotransferase domain-containing protein [Leifsonia sp. TF02-11]MBO1739746.1 type 1 glutamine amidotransferase [Leifsonia sp. TF02-11]
MSYEDKRVAFLVGPEGIEQAELVEPWKAVTEAGATAKLISKEAGSVRAFNHLTPAEEFPVDLTLGDASPDDFDLLVLPGGVANGDQVRTFPDAVALVKGFAEAGKPIAVICHGGWVLIEAGVVGGRTLTSWPSLQTDYRNAGATWVDEEVVVDSGAFTVISSRKPDDLPAFNREVLAALA